jgi:predicted transcriptional regulator
MTVAEAAEESGVTAQTALERLRESGLDARAGDRLRDLADTAGRRSSGVYAIISGQEP